MPKTEPKTLAATTLFDLVKDTGKTHKVVVTAAKGDKPEVTEDRPVLLTGDEAMAAALEKAQELGYSKVSMQQENDVRFQFMAYEPKL